MSSSFYGKIVRPLMFRLSPDRSHMLANTALQWPMPWHALGAMAGLDISDPRLHVRFAGVDMPNPVGLAAGFDKDCDLLAALSRFGFGSITVGSIMPEPRHGNPFPRLVRYPDKASLADSMGVPSKGRDHSLSRLAAFHRDHTPVFANIGGFTADEIAMSFHAVAPHVDAVEVSLMCPNAKRREDFDPIAFLREILDRIAERQKPAVVRVPNDVAQSADRLGELIDHCVEAGVTGLKVGGGQPVAEARLGTGKGTLHGKMIFETALGNVARAARLARGRIQIRGNGGVSTAADVVAMLQAGACCVDLYSAFIYDGWRIAADINEGLLSMLDNAGVSTIAELASTTAAAAGHGSTEVSLNPAE